MNPASAQATAKAPKSNHSLDVNRLRADFPILAREVHGSPLVYLDSAATSQKPQIVIDTIVNFYKYTNANVHRGVYALSAQATDLYEGVRNKVVRLIGSDATEEIIFTRNATEAINLVAQSWGDANLKAGDEILLTEMEHHSNLVPWFLLAKRTGAVIRYLPIRPDGTLAMEQWEERFTVRTKLVAVTHTSNVVGTINPIADIVSLAHRAGALVLVDAAQGAPHCSIDVQALDVDFLAVSAHKMLGPTGVGVLYGRRELLEKMEPVMGGGDMIRSVKFTGASWNDLPWKFEAGTPNIADVIGFGAAIDYLMALGMDNVRGHEIELTEYALSKLTQLDGLEIFGPMDPQKRAGVISFTDSEIHPHDLATILDRRGIAIRAGHHCAQPLLERLGQTATARASFYVYNTHSEVDALIEGIQAARKFMGRG